MKPYDAFGFLFKCVRIALLVGLIFPALLMVVVNRDLDGFLDDLIGD